MFREKNLFVLYRVVGPGGWYCSCCSPQGRNAKVRETRNIKRGSFKRMIEDKIKEDLQDLNNR